MNSEDTLPNTTFHDAELKPTDLEMQMEYMLQNAVLMTEIGMDLREKSVVGEKHVYYIKRLALRASKTMTTIRALSKSFLMLAQKIIMFNTANVENVPGIGQNSYNIKMEYEKLLNIVEKELNDMDENETLDAAINANYSSINMVYMTDKIKYLESKQKLFDNALLPQSSSTKSVKSEVDEKYPENLSRESLIDLDNVVNLPTVPEDIFTCFSNKPVRTSSLSSLKSMRKVKFFLQRASCASDDDDESSEQEDHDSAKLINIVKGDNEDIKPTSPPYSPTKKILLGNIKEETQY